MNSKELAEALVAHRRALADLYTQVNWSREKYDDAAIAGCLAQAQLRLGEAHKFIQEAQASLRRKTEVKHE